MQNYTTLCVCFKHVSRYMYVCALVFVWKMQLCFFVIRTLTLSFILFS